MAYVADWLRVHKCIVTNITNKKTTKPTQSIFVWFLPVPLDSQLWALCSVLGTVNSGSRPSTVMCLGLFQQLLLLLLSFYMMLSRSHIFMSSQKFSCPAIGNLSLNQVLVSAGCFVTHSQIFVLFTQMEATNEMKTVKLTNTSHQSAD